MRNCVNYLKKDQSAGQNGPNAEDVNGHIDRLMVVAGVEGELLLQVQSVFEAHFDSL